MNDLFSNVELELDPDYVKVLRTLAKLRISYPTELARETFIDDKKVTRILDYYIREGAIKPVTLYPDVIPEKLRSRLHHFWNKGVYGFREFQKRRWVECEDKPYWGDKSKMPVKIKEEIIDGIQ